MIKNVATDIVKKHIDQWDPMRLLAGGAPNDEFEYQISWIVDALSTIMKESELADEINYIFDKTFDIKFDYVACLSVAKLIWIDIVNLQKS